MSDRLEQAPSSGLEDVAQVSTDTVRQQLQRILASALFRNARRPSQFLHFVVESTIAGEEDQLKEYVIAVEAFDRPVDYDPKADPIVRIEAGRLRKKLAEYYGGPGASDPIVIELPKGAYIPVFQPRSATNVPELKPHAESGPDLTEPANSRPMPPSQAAQNWRRLIAVAAVVSLAAVALASAYYLRVGRSTPTSIAVLPFLDLRADHLRADDLRADETSKGGTGLYLSDGVAEELTTGMAQLKGLRVVAATSAFQFRGKSEDVRKIGQALNAETLLEGSISQSPSGLRINAQLIDTRSGYHLWSSAYDVQAGDVLSCEQDIVRETARVLRLPASSALTMKRDTENAEAHDLYLHGRYLWNTRQLADMLASVKLFERAIQDDPNYALAYAGLADTYTVMAINSQMPPAEALPHARAALQRALELDPSLARAHATLGLLKSQCEWDWRGAEEEFHKAIELQPNYAPAHHWAALDYMQTGQFAAADAEFRQAQVLDPLSPMISEGLAENFYDQHRYDEAISTVLHMPNPKVGWVVLAYSYIFKGMYEDALKLPEVVDIADLNGRIVKAEALVGSGNRAAGLKILENMEQDRRNPGAGHDYIPPGVLGYAYAVAGEKERAFGMLEKAYQAHDPALANLKVDPGFDSLRADPRYPDLLRKVGLGD
ncbi:MAG: hypothetical protein WB729_22770 [Candidatus Sulfotelmatobacter sp.]